MNKKLLKLSIVAVLPMVAMIQGVQADSLNTGPLSSLDLLGDTVVKNKAPQDKDRTTYGNKMPLNTQNTHGVSVEIGGKLDMQYGVNSVSKCFTKSGMPGCGIDPTTLTKKIGDVQGLGTDTRLSFNVFKQENEINLFGAYLEIDTNRNAKNVGRQSYIYLNGKMGRLEVGTTDGSSSAMQVSASSIALGTGGPDGDLRGWNNYKAIYDTATIADDAFMLKPHLPVNAYEDKKQNRVSYYTPELYGMTVGLSYTPNVRASKNNQGNIDAVISVEDKYTNLFDLGLKYQRVLSKGVKITTGLTSQFASSNKKDPSALLSHKVAAYEVGAQLDMGSLSFAGSFADYGKSNTYKDETGKRGGNYYTLGTSYKYSQDLAFSLTYFNSYARKNRKQTDIMGGVDCSNDGKNKTQYISVASEYVIKPGMKYYAEVNRYKYNSDAQSITNKKIIGNKGYTILTGLRVQF